MNLTFTDDGWDDFLYWALHDRAMLKRISNLITDIKRGPFDGIGKPERLKYFPGNIWSRRIDKEHRLVYAVIDDAIVIQQARYHY